jgi:hypothetical protein
VVIFEFDAVAGAIDFFFCAKNEIALFGIINFLGSEDSHARGVELTAEFVAYGF